MWPDWAIYWTLGKFYSLWQQLIYPNLPHSLAIFVKVSKSIIFVVKSFLGNFYRHLATFFLVTLDSTHLFDSKNKFKPIFLRFHSTGGQLPVSEPKFRTPLADAFLAAVRDNGHQVLDINAGDWVAAKAIYWLRLTNYNLISITTHLYVGQV